jgi:hypothetical protein
VSLASLLERLHQRGQAGVKMPLESPAPAPENGEADRSHTDNNDPDRWCWPHSAAMNGAEIDGFITRLAQITGRGIALPSAAALADRLARRDRESDDRRMCLECPWLAGWPEGWRCNNWRKAELRASSLPGELVTMLQRCEGFPKPEPDTEANKDAP